MSGADEAMLPSGQAVRFFEGFIETQPDGARWARFRYVLPGLRQGAAGEAVEADFAHLCSAEVLPRLNAAGEVVDQVIVSLMDKPVEFGQSDPGTVQFFESFAIRDGRCIWEGF